MNDEPQQITEADIPRPGKPVSQGGDEVQIFSACHYPINGTIWIEVPGQSTPDGIHWEIKPGDNFMRREVWDRIKDLRAIVSRMDHREIRAGYTSKMSDAEMLVAPAPRSLIRRLSAKAARIPDGQQFDKANTHAVLNDDNAQHRLRKLEAEFRKLTGG